MRISLYGIPPPKSPMAGRILVFLLVLCHPRIAPTQPVVSVDDAVRSALEQQLVQEHLDARIAGTRAELDEALLYPTPSLSLQFGNSYGHGETSAFELSAMLDQRLDLTGWRARLRTTLPHHESALRSEIENWRLELTTTVRMAYYSVRYHQERLVAMNALTDRLEEALVTIRARQEMGEASAYQTRRIARELELARAQTAAARSSLAEAWADLLMWTAWESEPVLEGALTPEPLDGQNAILPTVARLQHLEAALLSEQGVWGEPFWRDWGLGLGYRHTRAGQEVGHGILATLSVPLVLWNTDMARLARLNAELLEVRSELQVETARAERESVASEERLRAVLAALGELTDAEQDAELTSMAWAAFEAGEETLGELIGALNSQSALQLARIDLQWEARRAAIARQRSLGH